MKKAEKEGKAEYLNVVLEGCIVRNARTFGITVDHGAHVVMRNCVFEKNKNIAVCVKGKSDVSLNSVAFQRTKEQSKLIIIMVEMLCWMNVSFGKTLMI